MTAAEIMALVAYKTEATNQAGSLRDDDYAELYDDLMEARDGSG